MVKTGCSPPPRKKYSPRDRSKRGTPFFWEATTRNLVRCRGLLRTWLPLYRRYGAAGEGEASCVRRPHIPPCAAGMRRRGTTSREYPRQGGAVRTAHEWLSFVTWTFLL